MNFNPSSTKNIKDATTNDPYQMIGRIIAKQQIMSKNINICSQN